MLTFLEQKRVIKVLGKHYSGKIIPHLTKKGILNYDNNEFSAVSIRQIVTRDRENLSAELEIMQLVVDTELANKNMIAKRKQLTAKK